MARPYYEADGVALYLGDCRGLMGVAAGATLVMADPPYTETALPWDRWPDGWVEALTTTAAPAMWCWGSLRMFLDRARDFDGWTMAQDVVWEKHNGSNAAGDRFRRVHEMAVHWYRGPWADVPHNPVTTPDATARRIHRRQRPAQWGQRPAQWGHIGEHAYKSEDGGPRMQRSVIYCRSEHGRAIHPTQKPLGVLAPLIEHSTAPGDVVFDPFAGSCSTLVAAREMGRVAIGIEAYEPYAERAALRLSAAPLDFGASDEGSR